MERRARYARGDLDPQNDEERLPLERSAGGRSGASMKRAGAEWQRFRRREDCEKIVRSDCGRRADAAALRLIDNDTLGRCRSGRCRTRCAHR